jgi:hypothetical protein
VIREGEFDRDELDTLWACLLDLPRVVIGWAAAPVEAPLELAVLAALLVVVVVVVAPRAAAAAAAARADAGGAPPPPPPPSPCWSISSSLGRPRAPRKALGLVRLLALTSGDDMLMAVERDESLDPESRRARFRDAGVLTLMMMPPVLVLPLCFFPALTVLTATPPVPVPAPLPLPLPLLFPCPCPCPCPFLRGVPVDVDISTRPPPPPCEVLAFLVARVLVFWGSSSGS